MEKGYIHGTNKQEQERLSALNYLTNRSFINYVGDCSNLKICDFGCGLGNLINEFAELYPSAEITGVEISAEQIGKATSNCSSSNIRLVHADVLQNGLPSNYFDVVYCRYFLEHVHDPVAAVEEMLRVCKPGGKILSQENDLHYVIYEPEITGHAEVFEQYCNWQIKLGGDPFIGRKLYPIYKQAGATEIEIHIAPELYTDSEPEKYRAWLQNSLNILRGSGDALLKNGCVSESVLEQVYSSMEERINHPNGVALFHWNRVTAYKSY